MASIVEKLSYLAGATRFRRISEKLYTDGDKIYSQAGINFKASWFPVYYVLALSEEPLSVMQISEQIDFTHITVKNVIRELEHEALVTVNINPADKRSKLISLSVKGRKLLYRLKPIWISFSSTLKQIFNSGHPDFMNILNRIDRQIEKNPIHEIVARETKGPVRIIDYRPGLHYNFNELSESWLTGVVKEELEEEGCMKEGGFLFFARYKEQIVGYAALIRLDENSFELAKLYINPDYRELGIASKLIERCISRCMENEAGELWLQTTMSMPEALQLYYKLGFKDRKAPGQMAVLERTEKTMRLKL